MNYFLKIYKENKCKTFYSRNKLIEYKEREYIEFIEYSGLEKIEYGDLPFYGILEKVSITNYNGIIDGIIIPMGVSTVIYPSLSVCETILSTLPKSVTSVENVMLNSPIDTSSSPIPETIEKISFHDFLNPNFLKGNIFPKSLKALSILSSGFSHNSKSFYFENGEVLDSVEYLKIDIYLEPDKETELLSFLPKNLKILDLEMHGKITPFSLPNSITILNIRLPYNDPVQIKRDMIPQSVTSLKIDCSRFISIERDSLTNSLTILNLKFSYHNPLVEIKKHMIPQSVTKLTIECTNNYCSIERDSLNNLLNLTELSFIKANIKPGLVSNGLPPNLKKLNLSLRLERLTFEKNCFPESLTQLNFVSQESWSYETHGSPGFQMLDSNSFPKSLKSLNLPFSFNQPLKLTDEYILKSNGSFKTAIQSIFQNKNKFIPGFLIPRNVESLKIGYFFNQPINIGDLPDSLTYLQIGEVCRFTQSIFKQNLLKNSIPNNIQTLILPNEYCIYLLNDPKYIDVLPNSIKTLKFLIKSSDSTNNLLIQKTINNLLIENEIDNCLTIYQLLLINKNWIAWEIYNKNKCKIFSSRNELIEYKEREYIQYIKYTGLEKIGCGDLQFCGVLEKVSFDHDLPFYGALEIVSFVDHEGTIDGIIIPMGVSTVIYSKNYNTGSTIYQHYQNQLLQSRM
ncbi:hypothetical protein DDB_G0289091 [Dictyostelium discoideum AX4]|uniref:FNIP repeat-containing protein n=1 Tax=Dictyostelium discoideum TaxID=44689 RepID=Q54I07_DICDI|nr:hypothetical protein DDB_G0289091 [Dictyostelium discoideum AX4]EAL62895.1 hypothetical protein DDB_G0289091 [Dictyostelium discoideum AX4]|eukprot:XP_636398.1 hypothetical protein DDB_G0289091 [Dictyostelium discoideum AX4]